jgi:hypothetical protein
MTAKQHQNIAAREEMRGFFLALLCCCVVLLVVLYFALFQLFAERCVVAAQHLCPPDACGLFEISKNL